MRAKLTVASLLIIVVSLLLVHPKRISIAQDNTPLRIEVLGFFHTEHIVFDVYVENNLAYITAQDLFIIDVSEPTNPTQISRYDGTTNDFVHNNILGTAYGIQVIDNIAYIADAANYGGLVMIDVSNPAQPKMKGFYPFLPQAFQVQIVGDLAYTAGDNLIIYDTNQFYHSLPLGDQPRPKPVVDVAPILCVQPNFVSAFISDVEVVNNLAYVTSEHCGLLIIDVSNPTDVSLDSLIGAYEIAGEPINLTVVDNLVYVASRSGGLQIIDVSDPADPTLFTSYESLGHIQDVKVVDNLAYILDQERVIRVVDVTDPLNPVLYAISDTSLIIPDATEPFIAFKIYVENDLMYVVGLGGLFILRMSENQSGTEIETPPDTSSAQESLVDEVNEASAPFASGEEYETSVLWQALAVIAVIALLILIFLTRGAILRFLRGLSQNQVGTVPRSIPEPKFGKHIVNKMEQRGWSQESILETVKKPSRTQKTKDTRRKKGGGRENDPATAYFNEDGHYIVVNDNTGDIVQISDQSNANWIPKF